MRAFFKALVALSMVLATMAATAPSAAAVNQYPGVDPGLSVEFDTIDFNVGVGSFTNFFLQCGSTTVLPTVTDSTGAVIHMAGAPLTEDIGTFSWRTAVQAALLAAGTQIGDDVTVSFGPGCNSYTLTVLDSSPGIAINSALVATMSMPGNFGCGPDFPFVVSFNGSDPVVFLNASFMEIASAIGAEESSDIPAMLAAWSSALQNASPQPVTGDTIRVDWTNAGECPGAQLVTIGSVAGSDVPADSSALTRPALALAALTLSTVAVLGGRRLKASRS